jgi:hypothetical protein
LVRFIQYDQTDKREWTDDFNCVDFTKTLVANARADGFIVLGESVRFEDGGGHSFVVFATVDRGLIYIEPQTDRQYLPPEVNAKLCDTMGRCKAKIFYAYLDINYLP